MSRKDYRAIAKSLRESNASRETVEAIARTLALDNPRFSFAKFEDAALSEPVNLQEAA